MLNDVEQILDVYSNAPYNWFFCKCRLREACCRFKVLKGIGYGAEIGLVWFPMCQAGVWDGGNSRKEIFQGFGLNLIPKGRWKGRVGF